MFDTGSFIVSIRMTNAHLQILGIFFFKTQVQGIMEIKPQGRYRVVVYFNSYLHANEFLDSLFDQKQGTSSSIPQYHLTTKVMLKSVDTEFSDDELRKHLITPEKLAITQIHRFNKREITEEGVIYSPTKSVLVTFRSQTLPSKIFLYHTSLLFDLFKERPLQCRQCYKYGHSLKYCKSQECCAKCADKHPSSQCTATSIKCVLCGAQHRAYDRACIKFKEELVLLQLMQEQRISRYEAKRQLGVPSYTQIATMLSQQKPVVTTPKNPIRIENNKQQISTGNIRQAPAQLYTPTLRESNPKRKATSARNQEVPTQEYKKILLFPNGRLKNCTPTSHELPTDKTGRPLRESTPPAMDRGDARETYRTINLINKIINEAPQYLIHDLDVLKQTITNLNEWHN